MDSTLHEREEELYRLWEEVAGPGHTFADLTGRRVTVVSRGLRNRRSGPDYLDAVLLVDGDLRVGHVEMHRREEEWFLHGHDRDPAFEGVILHLLGQAPRRLRLMIPSVDRAGLAGPGDGGPGTGIEIAASAPSAALLAELAWERLLRRSTIILREEPGLPAEQRIVRTFIRRMYDSLGYMENREPMATVADRVLSGGEIPEAATLEQVAAAIFAASGLDAERFLAPAVAAIEEPFRANIVEHGSGPPLAWRSGGRPGNDPARRLWGAVLLTHTLVADRGLDRLFGMIANGDRLEELVPRLTAKLGSLTLVGRGRGGEIAINALLPTALAAGILRGDSMLAGRTCEIYRSAPALGSNRIIRLIEARYLRNDRLDGAFWQQGAIEFHQRYLSPDRTRLSFIADIDGRDHARPAGSTPA